MMARRQAVLVTGGAGYIGSHVVRSLRDAGLEAVVIDDLSTGRRQSLPEDVPLIVGDVGDAGLLDDALRRYAVGAVMHFAGKVVVDESVRDPLDYYRSNTLNSHALVAGCVRNGVDRFIFSSTAAVYGIPDRLPVTEDAPLRPISPYGASKLMTEWMLRDAARAHPLRYVALRYFNVAGADPAGRAGDSRPVATHLIRVACQAALGRRPDVPLFGEDYDTPDGTCVRDYIHVSDLAEAHVLALGYLRQDGESAVMNCGYGRGHSVREVLGAVEAAAGRPLPVRAMPRRAGDPPALVAASDRIRTTLGWTPRHADIDTIVRTALVWEETLPG